MSGCTKKILSDSRSATRPRLRLHSALTRYPGDLFVYLRPRRAENYRNDQINSLILSRGDPRLAAKSLSAQVRAKLVREICLIIVRIDHGYGIYFIKQYKYIIYVCAQRYFFLFFSFFSDLLSISYYSRKWHDSLWWELMKELFTCLRDTNRNLQSWLKGTSMTCKR